MRCGGAFPGTPIWLDYMQTTLPGCNKDILGTKVALQAAAKEQSGGENAAPPLVSVGNRPFPCSGEKEVNNGGVQGLEKGL